MANQYKDLVQETMVKALSNPDRFQTGTNIRAWLFTILRNSFFSELRKQRREIPDVDGKYAAQLTMRPTQVDTVEFRDFRRALLKLPTEQREALILVGPAGFSYEEAAAISRLRRRHHQESRQSRAHPPDRDDQRRNGGNGE